MNLQFKETQYNWGDNFYILDDNNTRKYFVKTSVMFWNRKFEICDLNKNVLAVIKKEPKSLLKKKYHIFINDQKEASITKEISLIPKYIFEGLDWQFKGFMLHEYDMLKGEQEIFSVHKELTPWGSRPVLKIAESVDEILALSVALTISYVMSSKDSEENTTHL